MSVFSQEGRSGLLLASILCITVLVPVQSFGQVIIKEDIELGSSPKDLHYLNETGSTIGTQNHIDYYWKWYQHVYRPQESGELKIALLKAESFLRPIDTTATFEISVWGETGRRDTTVKAQPVFGEPLKGSLFWKDDNDWYVYGKGPFQYRVNLGGPEEGKDATVRLLHDYTSETIGYDCSTCCPCKPIVEYTYEGEITDENLGNYTTIVAAVYDWGSRIGFPKGEYYGIYRSFFHLDAGGFEFPLEFIDSGMLEFLGYGGSGDRDEDDYNFLLHEVAGPWSEHTITWGNQPSVSGNPIVLQSPPEIVSGYYADVYELDITGKVRRWIEQPDKNFGLRLSLQEEQTDIDYLFVKHLTINGSDSRYATGSPELTINFSNPSYSPQMVSLNAGFVQPGDTVLIAYQNGTEYRQNATRNRSYTHQIEGKTYTGRSLTFEDREDRGIDPLGKSFPEYMVIFPYVGSKDEDEIMLGETNYYAAVKDPDSGEISVKEVETDANEKPAEPENIVAGAFAGNPIEVVSGGKSGVYWERKWAAIDGNGNISTGELPSGMIRLVGRYWEADNEYKVKLKATGGAELKIKVVKPDKLGENYGKAKDVFDQVVDVDSLIIVNAGKYGIPPQLVKGQMEKESATKDFVGLGIGFAPSYRYEPYYTDPYENRYFRGWAGDYYFEDSTSADFSDIPQHQHVLSRDYYREVKTIWDIVKNNSQLINETGPKIYGKRAAADTMDFGPYKSIQREYHNKYVKLAEEEKLTQSEIADSTNKLIIQYLRDEWQGGMKNHIAQTRVASSYGFLQPMYTTAREKGYPARKVPEDINLIDHFFYFVKNQKEMISVQIGENLEKGNNWTDGYEKTIRDAVYRIWNDSPSYPTHVLKFSKKYNPESKN